MTIENNKESMSGIFIAEYEVGNMDMERIVVSDPAIKEILAAMTLSMSEQEEAVFNLVDRTPEWQELTQEVQVAKIKTVLTQETILAYLVEKEIIRNKVDTVEVGIDEEGSVVVYAYYTKINREQRRKLTKHTTKKEQEAMKQAVNIFGSDDNIIDLAAKKIEKMKQQGKPFRGKKLT